MRTHYPFLLAVCALLGALAVLCQAGGPESWQLRLKASTGAENDNDNFLGVSPTAGDGYDTADILDPGVPPSGGITLYFPHVDWGVSAGSYAVDLRQPLAPAGSATSHVWDFRVKTYGLAYENATMLLAWENMSDLPSDYTAQMTDVTGAGAVVDMRAQSDYSFNVGLANDEGNTLRYLRVTVTTSATTLSPRSHVAGLPALTNTSTLSLSWAPDFADPPIASYTIQVYDEQSDSPAWVNIPTLAHITDTTGLFTGQNGHSYRFRSIARTAVGASETEFTDQGDTRTMIDTAPPLVALAAPTDLSPIFGTIQVRGSASDANLVNWTLDFAPANPSWQPTATYTVLRVESNSVAGALLTSWDTAGRNGNHLLRLRATDLAGNTAEAIARVNLLNVPPSIGSCASFNSAAPADNDGYYQPGALVQIVIQERNNRAGLTGLITIIRGQQALIPPIFDAPMTEDSITPGRYYYLWDTTGQPDSTNYFVETKLGDAAGHWDDNGANDFGPDLVITLDSAAPALRVTSENSLYPSDNDGVYVPGQVIRIVAVDLNGQANLPPIITINRTNGASLLRPVSGLTMTSTAVVGRYEFLWNTDDEAAASDYQARCSMSDAAGNTATVSTAIQLSTIAPTAIISSPMGGSYQKGTIDVRGTASKTALVYHARGYPEEIQESEWTFDAYWPDPVTNGVLVSGLDLTGLPDGPYSIRLLVSDTAAKVTSLAFTTFLVDTTPPSPPLVNIAGPPGLDGFVTNGSTITISGTCETNATISTAVLKDGKGDVISDFAGSVLISPNGVITGSEPITGLPPTGVCYAELTVRDAAGNVSAPAASNLLKIDNAGPVVSLDNLAQSAYFATSPLTLRGRCADAGVGVATLEVSSDNGASFAPVAGWHDSQWEYTLAMAFPGPYTLVIKATDLFGFVTSSPALTINYVPGYPICNLSSPFEAIIGETVPVIGTVTATGAFSWTLEYAPGSNPASGWIALATRTQMIPGETLVDWTCPEAPSEYTLRLSVTSGTRTASCYRPVSVSDKAPCGTPVSWLKTYGYTTDFAEAELDDPDKDGVVNWQEFSTETKPQDPTSVFAIRKIWRASDGFRISLPTVAGRAYRVDYSDDLLTWRPFQTGIQGDSEPTILVDRVVQPHRFYRAFALQLGPPIITKEPADQTVDVGVEAGFSVAAKGGEVTYQWRLNGVNLAGATGSTLVIGGAELSDAGVYDVVVRNASGSSTSREASLAVNPAGLVWIKPGTFTMGSPSAEEGRLAGEGPQTRVTLTKSFWMGRHEVTQREYEVVMGSNPSHWTGSMRPVEQVTWIEAVEFCQKRTVQERNAGKLSLEYGYRLPTEAEWEYACRAGTTTRFYWGEDQGYVQIGQYAWYDQNSGGVTHEVGLRVPNAWGLYDMNGNVWEWCSDWYGPYSGGSASDPTGAASGSSRSSRGGAWYGYGRNCRSADRYYHRSDTRRTFMGFRVVLAPVP